MKPLSPAADLRSSRTPGPARSAVDSIPSLSALKSAETAPSGLLSPLPLATDVLLNAAFRLQQDGRLIEAAQLYEQILQINPTHADSLHLLGLILGQLGKTELATRFIARAISAKGDVAAYYSNLGTLLQAQHQLGDAAACYRRALELDPALAEVHLNLGLVEQLLGRFAEAESGFRRAIELKPALAEAWSNLGNLLEQLGKPDEAEPLLCRALALKPDFAEAHFNLGNLLLKRKASHEAAAHFQQAVRYKPTLAEAWSNLGNLLEQQKNMAEAEACHRKAVALRPDWAEAHYNLGNLLAITNRLDESVTAFELALQLNPELTRARNNLGNVLRTLDRFEESVAQYAQIPEGDLEFGGAYNNMGLALLALGRHEEAILAIQKTLALVPAMAEAYCNLGAVYHAMNRLDTALLCYERARKLQPDLPKNRMNIGLIHLARGNFKDGWQQYEWRWQNAPLAPRDFVQPQWQGEPLNGRRILLHAEQGYGDTLQFLRYVPMVQQMGGCVLLEVQARLVRMAEALPGIEAVIPYGQPKPEFDCHLPLLSLPRIYATDLESIPEAVPYLVVPEEPRQQAAQLEWPADKLKIGLNWAGNPSFKNDLYRFRSLDFNDFKPLFDIEGVQFYSLQMGDSSSQLDLAAGPITDLSPHTRDMADTAAQMEHLDLILTADTSLAHLAGGLGKPVWVPLPYSADWRWMLNRPDSPWYPTMQLIRQPKPGAWTQVIETIREALGQLNATEIVRNRMRRKPASCS